MNRKVSQNSTEPGSDMQQQGKIHMQWIVALLLNLTSAGCGLVIAWPVSVTNVLQSEDSPTGSPLSTLDISWLISSPNLAAMCTTPLWAFLLDRFGRKPSIVASAVLLTIHWLFIVFGGSFETLMTGRVAGGIANGGVSFIMPIYMKELSQDNIRGVLGIVWIIARSLGILVMYIMGGYLSYYTILWICLGFSAVCLLAAFIPPESPTYYVKIGKPEIAAKTIASMRSLTCDNKVVQNVIDSLKTEDERFKSIPDIGLIGIFRQKAWCKGVIFMSLLMVCFGMHGGFTIINYAPTILTMFGVTLNAQLLSISIPIVMIIGCILSMVFIERLGRKPILGFSFLVSLVSFLTLATFIFLQQAGSVIPTWLTLLVLVIPVGMYAAAITPVPFVIMAEMFNFQIRAKVLAFLGMVGWGTSFIQILIYDTMTASVGAHATFLFFASIDICGVLTVFLMLPETKMKSVETIELELEKKFAR